VEFYNGGLRLFLLELSACETARRLYERVRGLPLSAHGYAFANPTKPFVPPDHYVYSMRYRRSRSWKSKRFGCTAADHGRACTADLAATAASGGFDLVARVAYELVRQAHKF